MQDIIGIGLAAGRGERFRPLTLKAKGYLRAKAAVRFLGRRVLDWIVHILHQQGLTDYIMVTKGKENRYQIRSIIGYGENLGVRVRYSHVRFDRENTGSADALLTNLEHFDITCPAFVFPTDSILDIDLPGMLEAHRTSGAVVTIATAHQSSESIAGRYGLIDEDAQGRVRGFIEKPSLAQISALYGATGRDGGLLPTNAGFYLVDSARLREVCRDDVVREMRQHSFDIGGNLLPWLVAQGYPVHAYQVKRMGDLGNIPSYLETMQDVLNGKFPCMNSLNFPGCFASDQMLVERQSLEMVDPVSHLTLEEKIIRGLITIVPPVRIGRYVQIYPGAVLSACNIDDDCEIYENVTITRSSIGAGAIIGPGAVVEDTLSGIMVELESSLQAPIHLRNYVAIGDEVVIREGVTLSDATMIHPRLKIPTNTVIPPGTEVASAEQVLGYL